MGHPQMLTQNHPQSGSHHPNKREMISGSGYFFSIGKTRQPKRAELLLIKPMCLSGSLLHIVPKVNPIQMADHQNQVNQQNGDRKQQKILMALKKRGSGQLLHGNNLNPFIPGSFQLLEGLLNEGTG